MWSSRSSARAILTLILSLRLLSLDFPQATADSVPLGPWCAGYDLRVGTAFRHFFLGLNHVKALWKLLIYRLTPQASGTSYFLRLPGWLLDGIGLIKRHWSVRLRRYPRVDLPLRFYWSTRLRAADPRPLLGIVWQVL